MSSGFHVRYSATTHVGRVRKMNEDSILAMPEQDIWVVADGMGGHEGGEFASQAVIEAIAMLPPGLEPRDKMHELRGAIQRAHAIIRQEADRRGVTTIGATVVTLMLANGHFLSFWAGDSRLYRLRDERLEVLTTDHSLVAEFVLSGQMTWDEADAHPQSNAITRAVGVGDELELDKIRGEVLPGDRFLLCSDGLNKYATSDMIRRVLARDPIETVAETLLEIALNGGGADNISIIVVDTV
jgi:protein phosphatase/serine/threonine-protein phosphatase Stp1